MSEHLIVRPDVLVPGQTHPLVLAIGRDGEGIAVGIHGVTDACSVLDERMVREVHAFLARWISARDIERLTRPAP